MGLQDELSAGEETAVEMGQKKAMAPDLKFHNELPGTKSIELSKHIKSECEKRGFVCSVKDLRHKGWISSGHNYTPFIKMTIEGKHALYALKALLTFPLSIHYEILSRVPLLFVVPSLQQFLHLLLAQVAYLSLLLVV